MNSAVMMFGVVCEAQHYKQLRVVERLADADLRAIEQIRQVATDNLNVLMGIAFNQYDIITFIWKYEARCTVYVSFNYMSQNMRLTEGRGGERRFQSLWRIQSVIR